MFPGSIHVREEGMQMISDKEIWEFARRNNFTIVTQDTDFYELTLLYGNPPKVILLKCGNTSTNNILSILTKNTAVIKDFIGNNEFNCLELY